MNEKTTGVFDNMSPNQIFELCDQWNSLSGFQRKHIIEEVWPESYEPAWSSALASAPLTSLTDPIAVIRPLSVEKARKVVRILREEDLTKFR